MLRRLQEFGNKEKIKNKLHYSTYFIVYFCDYVICANGLMNNWLDKINVQMVHTLGPNVSQLQFFHCWQKKLWKQRTVAVGLYLRHL